uniref:RING-CH-type domain-containing protein n=1 Tax=Alexandrium monilatum TaxID=311494 RepID=A0A7S4VTP1_9DINO
MLPAEYPLRPPSIFVSTPNGRFAVGEALCVSMTAFHAELWNPAWTIRSIILGFLSFWLDDDATGKGSLNEPAEERQRLAGQSWEASARNQTFQQLFPEFLSPPASSDAARTAGAAVAAEARGEAEEAPPQAEGQGALGEPLLGPVPAEQPGDAGERAAMELTQSPGLRRADREEEEPAEGRRDAERAAGAGGEEEGEPAECWICHDRESPEPLLQPCACRGSMSGVHASCIESWVRHHARSAPGSGPPSCPVCRQPYRGRNEVPGVGSFLCHWLRLALRVVVQLALLVAYVISVTGLRDGPCAGWRCALEILVVAAFCTAFFSKILVLTASFPRFQPPPCRQLQFFVVTDPRVLQLHMTEVMTAVFTVLRMAPLAAVPLLVATALPVARCLRGRLHVGARRLRCLGVFALAVGATLAAALALRAHSPKLLNAVGLVLATCWVAACALLLLSCIVATIHPLNAGPHALVAIALSLVRIFAPKERGTLVAIFLAHSALLAIGLSEKAFRNKLRWRANFAWLLSLDVAILTWVLCNSSDKRSEGGDGKRRRGDGEEPLMFPVSTAWMLLLGTMVLAVNWEIWVRRPFRSWQSRHAAFRLDRTQATTAADP